MFTNRELLVHSKSIQLFPLSCANEVLTIAHPSKLRPPESKPKPPDLIRPYVAHVDPQPVGVQRALSTEGWSVV
jgi:hypothetical protein